MSTLLDVLSLLACPNCLTTNTLKLQDIEDKKKRLTRFVQIECRDCEFKPSFYSLPQIDNTKDNRCRGMKTMEIMLGLYTVSKVSGLVIHHLLNCMAS